MCCERWAMENFFTCNTENYCERRCVESKMIVLSVFELEVMCGRLCMRCSVCVCVCVVREEAVGNFLRQDQKLDMMGNFWVQGR